MGQYANFYNSHSGDRVYDAESMSEWLTPFFTTGVFNGDLFVQGNGGMSVYINPGYVNINGKVRLFDESTVLPIGIAHATLSRIDSIVVRRDDIERNLYLAVIKGTNSSNPVAPSPVRENGIYDLVIAHVHVTPALAEVTQSQIEDTRMNKNICGWVASTVEEIPFEQIMAQWDSIQKDQNNEFISWFNSMKDQLSEDAAGHLLDEVNTLKESVTAINNKLGTQMTFSLSGTTLTITTK